MRERKDTAAAGSVFRNLPPALFAVILVWGNPLILLS